MGTSSSYRAPATPRWNAFLAALSSGDSSIDRIRSELFNAGDEWEAALASPAVASYAKTLLRLFDELPARFAESQRPDLGIVAIAAEARAASETEGFSPAVAVAERALLRILIAGVNGVQDGTPAETIAHTWERSRGSDSNDLLARFVAELVGQFARHVVDREAGRLATQKLQNVDNDVRLHQPVAANISATLAMAAEEVAHSVAIEHLTKSQLNADSWATLLHRTFDRGRTLPAQAS